MSVGAAREVWERHHEAFASEREKRGGWCWVLGCEIREGTHADTLVECDDDPKFCAPADRAQPATGGLESVDDEAYARWRNNVEKPEQVANQQRAEAQQRGHTSAASDVGARLA
eukprot:3384495-Prymnesium_polylepis.1